MKRKKRLSFASLVICITMLLTACQSGKTVTEADVQKVETSLNQVDEVLAQSLEASDMSEEMLKEMSTVAASEVPKSPSPDAAYYGPLKVQGSKLTDKNGIPVQLRGISSHGLSWYPQYVNYDAIKQMKQEWGVNLFRLAMYTAEYNGYCVGDDANRAALKSRIQSAVEATRELGVYLIIDWHILSDNNPQIYQDQSLAFFKEMAEKYKNEEHIIYEICNEPNGSTTWDDIKAYANVIIPAIREHSSAVILVGTPTWSQDIDQAAASPITGYDNIMYTLHYYAATHKEDLRQRMVTAASSGLPVFVSEFGICDASGNGQIDEGEADRWLETMNAHGISFVMWNFANKAESSSMIRPECQKTSGFTADDLTQAGKWFVNRMGTLGAPGSASGSGVVTEPSTAAAETDGAAEAAGTANINAQVHQHTSWTQQQSKHMYKYGVDITNSNSSDITGWKVVIKFSGNITIDNSWDGTFSADGSTLTITPASYNQTIQGNGTRNAGFIVEGPADLKVVEVTAQ